MSRTENLVAGRRGPSDHKKAILATLAALLFGLFPPGMSGDLPAAGQPSLLWNRVKAGRLLFSRPKVLSFPWMTAWPISMTGPRWKSRC